MKSNNIQVAWRENYKVHNEAFGSRFNEALRKYLDEALRSNPCMLVHRESYQIVWNVIFTNSWKWCHDLGYEKSTMY